MRKKFAEGGAVEDDTWSKVQRAVKGETTGRNPLRQTRDTPAEEQEIQKRVLKNIGDPYKQLPDSKGYAKGGVVKKSGRRK
jgi:hypothetical protein